MSRARDPSSPLSAARDRSINLSDFDEGTSVLQQAGYYSALAFNSSLYRAPNSAGGERFGLSQVFPGHVHPLAHVRGFLVSQEYVGTSPTSARWAAVFL